MTDVLNGKTVSSDGTTLHAILKQGVSQPIPGLMDDDMIVSIPVSHIAVVAQAICLDNQCGCDEPGDRCRCNTNIQLVTGAWLTVQCTHADALEALQWH